MAMDSELSDDCDGCLWTRRKGLRNGACPSGLKGRLVFDDEKIHWVVVEDVNHSSSW